MADSFYKLEDEAFPSFLCKSLDSTSGRATLGNVTLGSGPGLPVAASTVAKIRPGPDNRGDPVEASYLEGREQKQANSQSSVGQQPKFALSFKDDLDNADDFIAAHRLSDMLVKINLDESASRNQGSMTGLPITQMGSIHGRPTELGTDLSTGLLTFSQFGHKDNTDAKTLPATTEEDSVQSEGVDSDHFSGSNSSFLANEKLMSVDSMNSDITDDDIDSNNLPDDELELYFNKLVPPAMQRGRVEGQEIPATGLPGAVDDISNPSSTEPDQYRHYLLDDYNQEDFRMPDVRLAATGMDSCPASDEDTEDELESARRNSSATRTRLLPSTSRQLVGESNRPSFRPGLEGGSSDDEASSGRGGPSLSGIEHRRSAEGQVINPPVTGDGGGGDGSSGSEESGNDGGVSTIPLPTTNVQTTYDVLRGLGIVGSSAVGEDVDGEQNNLPGHGRNSISRYTEMGDRVGPVGTGEGNTSFGASGETQRLSPVNWSMVLDRQEALDAMESTETGTTIDRLLDSVYLRSGTGPRRPQVSANPTVSHLQGTQGSFHLSQVLHPECDDEEEDDGVDEPDGARPSLGLRGGPCGDVTGSEASGSASEDDNNPLSTSLEPKYFSQSFHQDQEDSDDGWNHCPDNLEQEFQQGTNATHNVVYQNENGEWVTDLAYYSSFEKEVDGKTVGNIGQFQMEEFVSSNDAMEKIAKDQEEFEKEHQFMQEEKIEPASSNSTFHSDSSWKLPASSHILMRASQLSSQLQQEDQSYLRLSFGQFIGQRSEALGCLGNTDDVNGVKRPSFGYIITSPEKREPFPLIHPSEFSARDSPSLTDNMDLSEADKTLNPEDLDKTLEAPGERMSPKGDTDPEPCEQEDHAIAAAVPDHSEASGSESSLGNKSCVSPENDSSHLMLSISTIASAIADASISTDPSQLAAMIMELSKRSRARNRPEYAGPVGPAGSCTEEPHADENILSEPDQSAVLDTLQRSTCVGELSAFDIEKYLKMANVSGSSNGSVAHTTFDLTGWADNFSSSQRNLQAGYLEQQGSSAQRLDSETQQKPTSTKTELKDRRGETTLNNSLSAVSLSRPLSPGHKSDSKRSSIPRPRTSCSSARRSVGSGQASSLKPPAAKMAACDNSVSPANKICGSSGRTLTENGIMPGELNSQASNNVRSSFETTQNTDKSSAASPVLPRTSPDWRKGQSGLPCFKGSSPPPQRVRSAGQQQQDRPNSSPEKRPPLRNIMPAPLPHGYVEKHVGFSSQNTQPPLDPTAELLKGFSEPCVEETQCNFRPSTSPLTHSSPSQTSFPSANSMLSPASSSGGLADKRPGLDLSPQSTCSSPSLSRLTYISMNDGTVVPTPERQKNNCTMALSTTIIRFSPTPPVEPDAQSNLDTLCLPKSLDQVQPQHSKSLDPLPQQCKSPELSCNGSALSCTRSQSECNHHCQGERAGNLSAGCRNHKHLSESNVRQLTKVDSGYCSNVNIQQTSSSAASQSSQQWGAASSVSPSVYAGGLGMPPSFSSEGPHYMPISSFKPQCAGLTDLPHQGDIQSLLAGRSLFNSQLAQQYLGPEAPLHPGAYHVGTTGNGLFSVSSTGPLGISGAAGSHHLTRPHQSQQDMGIMGKPYSQYGAEPLVAGVLEELRGQVVVPEELRFPHACCVGIASQTSLSLFNPSERWQQVSITVSSLAIDGEKVDSLPYQWLIVKNKTIIGPKSTEEQKVLFIPPQAGVYQCVLSVCSWPASAETETAARASIFAKRVLLVAIAENPALEVEVSKSGCLDFGDLTAGSAKSLPLKLLNRTHATVPIRLVISANAAAWRCFTFSKQPVPMTSEATQQAGHMNPVSSPSVMNHVMHASYGENPESFMVWVHFKAPQKFTVSSGELGAADEYSARVDIEVDSPGPSHVISSIPLMARSGTARVHAPKDLQTVSLSAPLGKSSQQMLPLKNAGNIDVQLKLKRSDAEDSFSVTPDELSLRVGEEQGIVVSFKAQGSRKYRESLLTILVLPLGPQYEVTLRGEVVPEGSGKPAIPSAAVFGPGAASDVPPILSNKQFVAWGGVTLGRAVQQKLVLRNNSANSTQQLRLLIRGQDQDCFQLQSMFSPEERLTRHGELSIRPREDVTVHLLFAPTRVACMLAKLEIKQSGVRPSQPGVKFTIPLSGYGGTSNIILEDQRKQADGYVATLTDIAVGRVSKVCLCVRNTGSRAAFIKAIAFSDVQTRSLMEPTVISLAPSQFVLKERTQEVITVLMKSTQREETLCQSANALLATVCLFCGDEVSRQQYRRLLQSKPEAARKALSENSLLKNIDFNEKFLGEENVTETYDLPQRPNEAHIFYGNMSKIAVSLLGSTKSTDCEQSDHSELLLLPSARRSSETDSGLPNGNVSLDVLPVKGPQGPALRVTEPSIKASEPLHRQSESWTIHPEQLVLAAPTINGATATSQVQIRNNTPRELSFDLSWPAHCLTITPQHGVIEPQCHLQILISPNPSLATKSNLLPWSGQIYVQCDGQQKFIKVQIRRDLALDVSAAPADTTLSALPPQAATPVLPVARLTTKPSPSSQTPQAPQALVEISNKTIIFPTTPSGDTSEAQLEVQNGEVEVRWYLSSFAPPYVKGVDNTGDVYRATYTAFRCSRVSGTLGAHEKMQMPITFLPRDRGDYAQFWDLECHPLTEPQQKTRIRFQLCGTGMKSGPVERPQEGDCSLVKTEATVKTRKRADVSAGKPSQEEAVRRGVYSPQDLYTFPATRVGESSTLKVNIRNNSSDTHEITALSEATRPVQAQYCRQTRWLAAHPVRNKWKSCYSANR
ncbi:centrosomal protein of 192 kDa isoform X2 [Pempheris klunzingeri]|uniref:centrosomal protein of 192 kDa isoform X2 n=1 Tax=Pempheris klunzingeri TaxID=3127111 RepID=UPI00397EDF62